MHIKIFTDGGSRGNPGNAGIGVVAYKTSSEIEFEQIKIAPVVYEHSSFIGIATNNEAEYKALNNALTWLNDSQKNFSDVEKVEVYLDSKLVVEQINRNWKVKDARMQVFAKEAWDLLTNISIKTTFTHVRREKNKEADALVNQALDAYSLD